MKMNDIISKEKVPVDRPLNPVISIIIVSYNTADFLKQCLASIEKQSDIANEVFVVDNASTDGSPQTVESGFKTVKLIRNQTNLGFSRANNEAIAQSEGRYILFLNPDTEVHTGAFAAMVRYLGANPDIGLAGAKIVNPDGSLQDSVEYRYPGQRHCKTELSGLPGKIAWLSGAAIIARRETIEAIKGFDERYFLYGEDIDLCLCARKAGWKIGFIPEAIITHWGGQSERTTPSVDVWRKKFNAEIVFYRKHYNERTLRSICRANILQSYWRIITLLITMPVSRDKQNDMAKRAKYRLALNFFRNVT